MIIYKATNLINGKIYIGQTVYSLIDRANGHVSKSNTTKNNYFHNAIKKYGASNFKWQVVCLCPNIKSLNEQEEYYIAYYNLMNNGYNLKSGGLNNLFSDKSKNKIRSAMTGKKHSEETKNKISIARTGKKHTKHTKIIMSINNARANLGRKCSEEIKEKMRQSHLGKSHSEETKLKMKKAWEKRRNK